MYKKTKELLCVRIKFITKYHLKAPETVKNHFIITLFQSIQAFFNLSRTFGTIKPTALRDQLDHHLTAGIIMVYLTNQPTATGLITDGDDREEGKPRAEGGRWLVRHFKHLQR